MRFNKSLIDIGSKLFVVIIFFCSISSLWINDKPVLLKYNQKWYFPIIIDYSPEDFGLTEDFVLKYDKIEDSKIEFILRPIVYWNPYQSDFSLSELPAAPSLRHFWGTDDRGRDLFARCFYASKNLIIYVFIGIMVSLIIGVILGSFAGFIGGVIDFFIQRFVDVTQSIPLFFLATVLFSVLSFSVYASLFFLACFQSVKIIGPIRTHVQRLRKQEFVDASMLLGMTPIRIWWVHILRHCDEIVFSIIPSLAIQTTLILTALDFLGLGFPPPQPSFGEIFSQAQKQFLLAPWILWIPAIFFFLAVLSLILFLQKLGSVFDKEISN